MHFISKLEKIPVEILLQYDAFVCGFVGFLFYVHPGLALSLLLNDQTDGVHWHLCRCCGAILLGKTYLSWKIRNSRCKIAQTACLKSRIIAAFLIVLATLHAGRFHGRHFTSFTFIVVYLGAIVALFINVTKLFQMHWPKVERLYFPSEFWFNCLIQVDACAALVIGCAWLAIPDWILNRQVQFALGGSHLWLGRLLGALFISTALTSYDATWYSSQDDRRQACLARAVTNTGILLGQLYSQIAYHSWWSGVHWLGIFLYSTWTGIVFYVTNEYCIKGKTF